MRRLRRRAAREGPVDPVLQLGGREAREDVALKAVNQCALVRERPRAQRKGESQMSRHSRPERNPGGSARRNGTHKAAAVERYERRLSAGGTDQTHQTAAERQS